jgi:fimbrial chaperone protein
MLLFTTRGSRRLCCLLIAGLGLWASQASAQLQVRPIPAEVSADYPASTLIIANNGVRTMAVQARVFAWDQEQGEDVLLPTEAIALSPAITEIEPGSEQVFRILRLIDPPADAEQSFRIVLDELPGEDSLDRPGAIAIRLQMVIPLFVRATGPVSVNLGCSLSSTPQTLFCENTGGAAARLTRAWMENATGDNRVELASGLLGYALPGKRQNWTLPETITGSEEWSLHVEINGEPRELTLRNEE